jgi:alpha-glucosidase
MPWRPDEAHLGFTTGTPWLPAAREHAGLTIAEQHADPDSTLAFARAMIAFKQNAAAMKLGDIEFLAAPEPVLAFVRRDGDDAIVCVFNLAPEPSVFEHAALGGAELLPIRTGEADLRGGSLGLSPYAAVFARLPR